MGTTATIFSGFGGQGVLMMGYVLATSGMHQDKHVTFLPAYGAEVRGGTANCTVTVSDEPIASPVASLLDFAILMNTPSLLRFETRVKTGGTVFLNSDLVELRPKRRDIQVVAIPVNSIAERVGNLRGANMVMIGALVQATGIVSLKAVIKSVEDIFEAKGAKIRKANTQAIKEGAAFVREPQP
ncbi:MAG TPA: 2-oxoacid:ferredoxin oxidoreductase subunit gamma [Desulfobacterales bacterium]|jgi:2-oxoglutarate ferredoxin oxidoreductase subunit gamma|nr:2-oxoacid:ferredoxin oxidoreductase subunit gamma [Desulfobacterales bacterium]